MRLITPDFRITRDHGKWFDKGAFSMCAVYHPSYLLRSPSKKEDMLTDMKRLREKLDLLCQKETETYES
jgi:DNA polymerase